MVERPGLRHPGRGSTREGLSAVVPISVVWQKTVDIISVDGPVTVMRTDRPPSDDEPAPPSGSGPRRTIGAAMVWVGARGRRGACAGGKPVRPGPP